MTSSRCRPTVFVVHEDQQTHEYLRQCLFGAGYQVLVADSGLSALALVSGIKKRRIDLLLACPRHGMLSGLDLARWIHRSHPRLRYLELAPAAPKPAAFPCAALPVPVEKETLLDQVRKCLDHCSQAA